MATVALIATSALALPVFQPFRQRLYAWIADAPQAQIYQTTHGWIITDDRRKAEWAAARLAEAAAIYRRHFRGDPGRGVIVEMTYSGILNHVPSERRNWTLRWPSSQFPGAAGAAGVSRDDHHLTPASAMRHELGHLFFMRTEVPNTLKMQYGGDAPDWLDEAAAVLMETREVRSTRRVHFRQQVCSGRLKPLGDFLEQQHPIFAAPKMQQIIASARKQGGGQAVTMTIPVSDLGIDRHAAADFYAQADAVAEFLIERARRPDALSVIARDFRSHGSADFWSRRSPGGNVGIDRTSLDVDFQGWADSIAGTCTGRPAARVAAMREAPTP